MDRMCGVNGRLRKELEEVRKEMSSKQMNHRPIGNDTTPLLSPSENKLHAVLLTTSETA
jgi:hypothetical protein